MGFDAQAFATAFLEGQAIDIKARIKEAKDEIKRKKELARTVGVSQFKKRTQLYETMKNQVLNLKNYHGTNKGMTQKNLNALMDNPAALVEVNNILKDYETKFQEKMDVKTMNDLITFTGEYSSPTDQDGKPISLDQRLRKVAGLYMDNHQPTSSDPSAKETNMFLSMFGIDAENRMLANLSQQDRTLIEMAEQGEYVPENLSPISVDYTKIDTVASLTEQNRQFDEYKNEVLSYIKEKSDKIELALNAYRQTNQTTSDANVVVDGIDYGMSYNKLNEYHTELESKYRRALESDQYEGGTLRDLEKIDGIGVNTYERLYNMKGNKSFKNNSIISASVKQASLEGETKPNINETKPNINETKSNINETKPNINETKSNINETKPNINEAETETTEAETKVKADLSRLTQDEAKDIVKEMIKAGSLVAGDRIKLPNGSTITISQQVIDEESK